jgi:hypothetical protein
MIVIKTIIITKSRCHLGGESKLCAFTGDTNNIIIMPNMEKKHINSEEVNKQK